MSKYAKYASWMAKAIIAVAAVASAVLYFKTFEDVHLAMLGSDIAMLSAFITADEVVKLKERIEIIESKQRGFMSFETAIAAEQLDCKERVDALAKKMDGE